MANISFLLKNNITLSGLKNDQELRFSTLKKKKKRSDFAKLMDLAYKICTKERILDSKNS